MSTIETICVAFDAAMQSFVEVWENKKATRDQALIAYGAAAYMFLVLRKTTDAKESANHAANLLNQAAIQLGCPPNN